MISFNHLITAMKTPSLLNSVSARLASAGTVLDLKDAAGRADRLSHKTAAAACHFGDLIRSEMLHDLVERGRHGRQRSPASRQPRRDAQSPRMECAGWPSTTTGAG